MAVFPDTFLTHYRSTERPGQWKKKAGELRQRNEGRAKRTTRKPWILLSPLQKKRL